MSLACSLCTYIFVGKILKSMCNYCKSIFKLVMNDLSIVLCLSSHSFIFFLLKELNKCKCQNEKRYCVAQAVAHTSIRLGKRESDLYKNV